MSELEVARIKAEALREAAELFEERAALIRHNSYNPAHHLYRAYIRSAEDREATAATLRQRAARIESEAGAT